MQPALSLPLEADQLERGAAEALPHALVVAPLASREFTADTDRSSRSWSRTGDPWRPSNSPRDHGP